MDVREQAKRLGQLKYLKGEVDMLSQRIAELMPSGRDGEGVSAGISGASRGEAGAEELARLRGRLTAKRARCMALIGALYAFIDDIDDSLIRQIMTYRYIDGDTWRQVAARIGERDEQYPRRLHNRYLAGKRVPHIGDFDKKEQSWGVNHGEE